MNFYKKPACKSASTESITIVTKRCVGALLLGDIKPRHQAELAITQITDMVVSAPFIKATSDTSSCNFCSQTCLCRPWFPAISSDGKQSSHALFTGFVFPSSNGCVRRAEKQSSHALFTGFVCPSSNGSVRRADQAWPVWSLTRPALVRLSEMDMLTCTCCCA